MLDPKTQGEPNVPALPPGFVLDKKDDDKSVKPLDMPPLPPGATLDEAPDAGTSIACVLSRRAQLPGASAAVSTDVHSVPFLGRAAQLVAGANARRGGLAAVEYGATSRAGQYEGAPDIEGDGRDGFDTLIDDGMGRLGAAFDPSAMALDYRSATLGHSDPSRSRCSDALSSSDGCDATRREFWAICGDPLTQDATHSDENTWH